MAALNFLTASFLYTANTLLIGGAACTILGRFSKIKLPDYSAIPVAGIVCYSLYIAITGSVFGLNKVILNAPLALCFFYRNEIKRLLSKISIPKTVFCGKREMFFLACVLVVLAMSFFRVFGTRIMNDSLVYHLYIPKQYALFGKIFRVPFSEHALWPQLSSMYFTYACLLSSIPAAKFFSYLSYLLIGIFTFLFIRLLLDKNRELSTIGAALILSTPAFFLYAPETYVDLTVTFFAVAMLYFLYRYYQESDISHLLVSGIACAGALSSKYTAALIFISGFATIFLISKGKRKIRDLFLFCITAIGLSSFWYIRSYIESGNPIFPFGMNIFGTGFPSPVDQSSMTILGRLVNTGTGSELGAGRGLYNFLMLPFDLTFRCSIFGAGEKIGFIFLTLLPFFILSILCIKKVRLIGIFIAFYSITWFFLNQTIRFLFPILPLYVVMSVVGLRVLWDKRIIRILFLSITGSIVLFQTLWSGYYFYQDFEYVFKREPRNKYLDYSYRAAEFLKAKNIKDGKVLLVGDNLVFHMPPDVIRENTFRNFTHYDLKEDRLGVLKSYDIQYVFINAKSRNSKITGRYSPVDYFLERFGRDIELIGECKDSCHFMLGKIK